MDGCICFWYASTPGRRHTAIKCDGTFEAIVSGMRIGFRDAKAVNTILETGLSGGKGFIADRLVWEGHLNNPAEAFRSYLRGVIHTYGGRSVSVPSLSAAKAESVAALFGKAPALSPANAADASTDEVESRKSKAEGPYNHPTIQLSNYPTDGGWTFVSVTNGVCDDVCGAPCGYNDLTYHFRCFHDAGGLIVETVVRDDDVATDTCPEGAIDCRSWLDDCAEVFIDGEMARLDDSRKEDGKHLWHGGEFVLVANGAAQSNSSAAPKGYIPPSRAFGGELPDANWWTGEAFILPGYGHAERFYIPWRSMGHKKTPAQIGFTISLQDDDNGGERDHTLYWTGNPAKPHLDERAFGVLTMVE